MLPTIALKSPPAVPGAGVLFTKIDGEMAPMPATTSFQRIAASTASETRTAAMNSPVMIRLTRRRFRSMPASGFIAAISC